MRLTALKSKEVDETGVCTNKKAEPRPGPARTEGQSPLSRAGRASLLSQADQDQHRPRGTAIIPGQTRTSIDQDQHRPRGRALFPRQTRTSGSMLMSHQQKC
jgi:hypothetical protein